MQELSQLGTPQELSPSQDLTRVEFATVMRGYDKDEVDTFLHELAAEHERLVAELTEARKTAEKAHRELGEDIGDLLQHAKDISESMVKKAEEEAAVIKEKARRASEQAAVRAGERAQEVIKEAEGEAATRIAAADRKVKELISTERAIRARLGDLRSTLEAIGKDLVTAENFPSIEARSPAMATVSHLDA